MNQRLVSLVSETLKRDPIVVSVRLAGSRARGDPTELSDWDYEVASSDFEQLRSPIEEVVAPFQPLGQLWDPLAERATYMLMLAGPTKIDLLFQETSTPQPPRVPSAENLDTINAHFWDWLYWLGGKSLRGEHQLVSDELRKISHYLLIPIGADVQPETLTRSWSTASRCTATSTERPTSSPRS